MVMKRIVTSWSYYYYGVLIIKVFNKGVVSRLYLFRFASYGPVSMYFYNTTEHTTKTLFGVRHTK